MPQYSSTATRYSTSECAFLVDLPPMCPDEDGTKGGKVLVAVPPMRPDDDPIGGGSRRPIWPEDPAAGGERRASYSRRVRAAQMLDALATCSAQMPLVALLSRTLETVLDLVPAEVHQPIETILYAVEVRA